MKRELRRRLLAARPDAAAQAAQSAAIRTHLLEWLGGRNDATIALFSPLPGEPDLSGLPAHLPGKRWALPRVDGPTLVFHDWSPAAPLRSGAYGIAEPPEDAPRVDPREIDHFLCPGLGFSPAGARLGRGKGYYDRALATARPDATLTGIAFREQVVGTLPTEPHDLFMRWLATPDGVIRCG